jgi:hypothetical protein
MSFNLRPGTSLFGNVTFTPGTNENYVAPPIHGTASGTTTTTVNYVLVGAYLDDDNEDGSGSVYVYDANDLTAQPTKLTAPDAADGDWFGYSVTGVGDKIVVGSRRVDVDGQQNAGAIYVYDANDLTAQPTKLTAYDADWADDFGYSVASYGDKIVVGSRLDDDTKGNSGSVYVFDATDLTAQPTKLNAFDAGYGDQFGQAIAVSSNKIVVGAYKDDTFAGSAYVFDINDLSAQPTKLMPPDTADDQLFANAVAISEDKIVIGAYGDDESNPSSTTADSGAAYVYDANDLTAQPTKLVPSDVALNDSFGKSVAIFDDKIVIGSYGDDDPTNSGSIYIYDANDLTAEPTKLTAPDAAAYHTFGGMLSYVGDTLVVSAYNSNDDGMTHNGAVYVYDASDLTVQPTKLTAPDAASYDYFGQSVAISYTTTTTSSESESSPEPAPAPEPEPEPEPYIDPVWPVLLDRAVYNSTEGTGSGTLTFGDWTYGSIFDNGQGTRHPIGTVTDQGLRIQAPHWSGGDWWIEPDTSGKVQVEIIGRYDNFEGSYSRIDLFLTNGPVDSTDTPDLVIVPEGTQGSDTFMVYAYLNGNSRITIRTLNTINGVSTIEKVTLL